MAAPVAAWRTVGHVVLLGATVTVTESDCAVVMLDEAGVTVTVGVVVVAITCTSYAAVATALVE